MLRSILSDYGLAWAVNRGLYTVKLKLLGAVPASAALFEHDVSVSRIDLFDRVIDFDGEREFLRKLPKEQKDDLIAKAEKAAHGTFMAFSSLELSYGDPIDWFTSPVTEKSVDRTLEWYRIPDFSEETGDIKVIWEPSRFTHLLLFARAALMTGDEAYHDAFSSQLSAWVAQNAYGYGPNYKCGQEASLRMFNVLMAYSCFKYLGMTTEDDERCVREIVEGSYKKVLSNFFYARRCIRNNHTLSEACGMYVGAWCCGDIETMAKALGYFEEAVRFQFRSDGGYVQWSFNYQRFALQICELLIVVLRSHGRSLSRDSEQRILRSAELLYQFQDEQTGWLPNYGSNDGALPFPLSQCGFRDYSPTINAVMSLLAGSTPYANSLLSEEAVWFGLNGVPESKTGRFSHMYSEAGLAVLREGHTFVTLCAQDYRHNRPGHLDQMHLDLWHDGENILCDGGTYSYASEEGQYLMSTKAHNTVRVGHMEQMGYRPPFLVYDWGRREGFSIGDNSIEATESFSSGYTHRREVKLDGQLIMVIDEVAGSGGKCPELRFHTKWDVVLDDGAVFLSSKDAGTVAVEFDKQGLALIDVEECIVSDFYMRSSPCRVIVARYEAGTRIMRTAIRIAEDKTVYR